MILTNAKVMCGDFVLRECDVRIEGGRIAEIRDHIDGSDRIDLTGKYLLPGFIDTHIHGAHGSRFDDAEPDVYNITEFEATQGVTGVAATVAGSIDGIVRECEHAYAAHLSPKGAKIVAIHSEGPFLSTARRGAMGGKSIIPPDVAALDRIIDAAKDLRMIISLAPEVDGADALIKRATERGVIVSMGHTDATHDAAQKAIELGATRMTHTFNAARPINHREPGVLGVALTDDRVYCEMICDLVHLHPTTIKLIIAAKGADKINVISDSSKVAGIEADEFYVGNVRRIVRNGAIYLEDGTIAGSTCTVLNGVKNLIKMGIPMSDVSKMTSISPAKSLGLDKEIGSIEVGKYADLVALDENIDVATTIVNGKIVYTKG